MMHISMLISMHKFTNRPNVGFVCNTMITTPSSFVTYLRVSTVKQGHSGLGLEAQQTALRHYIGGQRGTAVAEFIEVESGKGSTALSNRPKLREALATAKSAGAVLLIAKLDRLARNVHFITGLIESGVEFIACDMPHANKLMLQIHAAMAEHERDQISARTKAALAEAKRGGKLLGVAGSRNLRNVNLQRTKGAIDAAEAMRGDATWAAAPGCSLATIGRRLAARGHQPERGGQWHPAQVARLLRRLGVEHQPRPRTPDAPGEMGA